MQVAGSSLRLTRDSNVTCGFRNEWIEIWYVLLVEP